MDILFFILFSSDSLVSLLCFLSNSLKGEIPFASVCTDAIQISVNLTFNSMLLKLSICVLLLSSLFQFTPVIFIKLIFVFGSKVLPLFISFCRLSVSLSPLVHCFRGKLVCMRNMIQIHQFLHKILDGHHLHNFRRWPNHL